MCMVPALSMGLMIFTARLRTFFRRLRAEGRLVIVCLHPTAPFQLEILREICGRFVFVQGGRAREIGDFAGLAADPAVRAYLGDLAP